MLTVAVVSRPAACAARFRTSVALEADASEDGGGGAALLDGALGGGGDFLEDVEGLGAGFQVAEGEGRFGEGFEGREVRGDGGGEGEGEELLGQELVLLGEGDEVVAEDEEGGEEFGLALGELWEFREGWSRGDHVGKIQGAAGISRGESGADDNTLSSGLP